MKKIVCLLALIIASFTVSEQAHAAPGGYFHLQPVLNKKGGIENRVTDWDLTTGLNLRLESSPVFSFSEPENLKKIFVAYGHHNDPETNKNFYVSFYDSDKNLIERKNIITFFSDQWTEYELKNVKSIDFFPLDSFSAEKKLREFDVITESMQLSNSPVSSFKSTNITDNSVKLEWIAPVNEKFIGFELYKENEKIADLPKEETTFSVNDLESSTSYNFEIAVKYPDNVLSEKAALKVTTDKYVLKEVANLTASADPKKVSLSWKLTNDKDKFKHVTIYRKNNGLLRRISLFSDSYDPLFETNGTTFKDLTVSSNTDYTYLVTTTGIDDIETKGVTTNVKTPKGDSPVIVNPGFEETPEGDYIFTWEKPTTGQVKILIDSKEYKIIAADLKKIIIPKAAMKYNPMGDPLVTLVPIAEDGTEGNPTNPGENASFKDVKIPFNAVEVLKSSMSFIGVLGAFILLVLAVSFWRPIKNTVVAAIQKKRGDYK